MKRWLLIFLLFSTSLYGNPDYHVKNFSFNQKEIYIGDEVSLRLEIEKQPHLKCRSLTAEELPSTNQILFKSVSVQDEGILATIKIVFYPYTIGSFYLPKIVFEDFELSGIRVNVLSLKGSLQTTSSPLAVYRLRGFYIAIGIFCLLLMAVPVVLFAFLPALKGVGKRLWSRLWRKKPYAFFVYHCRHLEKHVESMDSRQLYSEIVHYFRRYLTEKTGENFFIVMTRDLMEKLSPYLKDQKACKEVVEMMIHSDAVRFGSKTEGIAREKKDLKRLQEVVHQIENTFIPKERR